LLNGFEKTFYMTKQEVEKHAKEYSQSYRKGYGPWKDDFESMAIKTVLKLLLSKFAPMTIEMDKAVTFDQGEVKDVDNMEVEYIDNAEEQPSGEETKKVAEQVKESINGNGGGSDSDIDREGLMEEITAKAKDVWGSSQFYKKIKEYVTELDGEASNMLELNDSDLTTLHDQIMSLETEEA
jgi:recombinational DNA repair protein RecT